MTKKIKNKVISIKIKISDLDDLNSCFKQITEKICEGNQSENGKVFTASYGYSMMYFDNTDFIEKKIDGLVYRVFKNK